MEMFLKMWFGRKQMKNVKLVKAVFTVLLCLLCCSGFAKGVTLPRVSAIHENAITLGDVTTVARNYVPEQYMSAFLQLTRMDDPVETANLRVQILAIGYHESEWKNIVSKPNRNKSRDYGYLQLNSNNINNKWFMEKYGLTPKDRYTLRNKNDKAELYLCVSIKFYKALYERYGDDAAIVYNCGETKYHRNTIPDSTYAYKKKVSKYLTQINVEVNDAASQRIIAKNKLIEVDKIQVSVSVSSNATGDFWKLVDIYYRRRNKREGQEPLPLRTFILV